LQKETGSKAPEGRHRADRKKLQKLEKEGKNAGQHTERPNSTGLQSVQIAASRKVRERFPLSAMYPEKM